MSPILVLARKDLRRRLADPAGLLLNLAIPLAIAGAMALTFGQRGGSEPQAPKLRMVVVNLDRGPISELLTGATQNAEAAKHMEIRQAEDRDEGLRLLRDGEYAALVVIPEGFGGAVLAGRKAHFELLKNPAHRVMPVAAQQITEVAALYLSGGAKLLGDDGPRLSGLFEEDRWKDPLELSAVVTSLSGRLQNVSALLFPPLIEVGARREQESRGGFDFISWMYPGIVVMGLLFTAMSQMKDLLRERASGTLARQLASPLGAGHVLLAKVLSVAVIVAVADLILMSLGTLALGVRWGSLLPLAASSVLLVLAATGFAALVFSVVRTERQGDALGGILTMVMSLLGGAFVPLQIMPDWMARTARLTVNFWGNETLRALTSGGGFADVLPYLGVLGVLAIVMTGLGVALLGRRQLAGAA